MRNRAKEPREEAERLHSEVLRTRELARRLESEAYTAQLTENAAIPVDRSQQTLTDGSPVTPDHREMKSNGQRKGCVVLSEAERAKGFVRPVRRTYKHVVCDTYTSMSGAIAETYARDPGFYDATFCLCCECHCPVDEFVWAGTDDRVGS